MKRTGLVLLALILLVVFLCGCGKSTEAPDKTDEFKITENTEQSSTTEPIKPDVVFNEVDKYNKDYDDIEFPAELDEDVLNVITPVNTNEEALEVANAILDAHHKQGKWRGFALVSILHSLEDNVWRFEYSMSYGDVLYDGGVGYIIIDGDDGAFIACWQEE